MSRYSTITAAEFNAAGGGFLVYLPSVDDVRMLSQSEYISWLNGAFSSESFKANIYTVANGFNITVANDGNASSDWRWIILRPETDLSTGTILLPPVADVADGQEILVTTTRQVASFTLNGNGASEVNGAPTVLAAGDRFKMKYNLQTKSWNGVV
jgi:hypothetical protein